MSRGEEAPPDEIGTVDQSVQPVSTLVTRSVPVAKLHQFEELMQKVIAVSRSFDGHLGVDLLRPEGGGIYQIVFRYRSHAEHQAWMQSEQRSELVAQLDALLGDGAEAEVRSVDGWEGWFVTPGYAPPVPPRRWKMAIITLAAVYPTVLGLLTVLRPLTRDWPLAVGTLLTMVLAVSLVTWLIMPALTTRLGSWLRS